MLTRRSLKLRGAQTGLTQTLIRHETLYDCGRAEAVLAQAQAQAEALLHDAAMQRDVLLSEAQAQFWQRAHAQLEQWEHERQQMWQLLEQHAHQLVNQALQQLLEETPTPAKLNALLRQLARSQREPISATLRCHPEISAAVQQWLNEQPDSPWRLHPDDSLAPDALQLSSEQGDFNIAWPSAAHALLCPEQT